MEMGSGGSVTTGFHGEPAPPSRLDGLKRRRSFSIKLLSGAFLFCVLTFSVLYDQFSRMRQGEATFSWHRLHFEYLWLLLVCMPFDTFASALRIWLVCRVLKRSARFWTCLKAEWANVGISMLTPSQTGGGFGQIYILSRSGISISTAMVISLITFLGTMIGLLCVGLYLVLISGASLGSWFSLAVWPLTLVIGLMALPLLWPGLFGVAVMEALRAFSMICRFARRLLFRSLNGPACRLPGLERLGSRLIDLAYQYHRDAWKFVREGRLHFAGICLLSLVFLMARCFMAFLCLRFLGVETSSLGEILKIQMALLFLLYFAPTPGSSGLAEFFSFSAMAAISPAGLGPYYNLLWRSSTLYLPAVLGLLFLSVALLSDTGRGFRRKGLIRDEGPVNEGLDSEEFQIQEGIQGKVRRHSSEAVLRPVTSTGVFSTPRFNCGDFIHHHGTIRSN